MSHVVIGIWLNMVRVCCDLDSNENWTIVSECDGPKFFITYRWKRSHDSAKSTPLSIFGSEKRLWIVESIVCADIWTKISCSVNKYQSKLIVCFERHQKMYYRKVSGFVSLKFHLFMFIFHSVLAKWKTYLFLSWRTICLLFVCAWVCISALIENQDWI